MNMTGFITVALWADEDQDIPERMVELPTKFIVCPRCEGHGTHLTPSIGEHAYSMEEFCESFDEEERQEYFRRGGRYDVTCHTCNGLRVFPEIDEDNLTEQQAAWYKEYCQQLDWEAEWAAESEAERRMGA